MSDFDDRKAAFEKKYEIDEALRFKVISRTAKQMGLWAAEKLGFLAKEAEDYAKHLVDLFATKGNHGRIIEHIEKDLRDQGHDVSTHTLSKKWEELHHKAHKEISGNGENHDT